MKILLTNNHLGWFGGSESWIFTMAEYLKDFYDVTIFTLNTGRYSEFINRNIGVNIINELNEKDSYDIMLINHNSCLGRIIDNKIEGKKIYTMHGKVGLCIPIAGANFYVAISEEVNDILKKVIVNIDEKNSIGKRIIIKNPINTKRVYKTNEINKTIKNILYIGQSSEIIRKVGFVAKRIGAKFKYLNKEEEYSYFPEREINNADLVFTLGRGTLESMACGRNVFVLDNRCYNEKELGDGIITKDNFKSLEYNNFSGRTLRREFTEDEIIDELYSYSIENGNYLMNMVRKNNNVESICNQYLSL